MEKSPLQNSMVNNDFLPLEFYLGQNYPNPFKEKTSIKYCVAYKTKVNLTVYDSDGKEIEKLVDEEKTAGTYEVEFNTKLIDKKLAPGEYEYRLETKEFINEKKLIIKIV